MCISCSVAAVRFRFQPCRQYGLGGSIFQVLYPKSGWIGWPLVAAIGLACLHRGALSDGCDRGWIVGGLIGVGVAWFLRRWSRFRPVAEAAPCLNPRSVQSPDVAILPSRRGGGSAAFLIVVASISTKT